MFSGYNPVGYKLAVWTLSAVMCGVAGALYVPQVGIINPGEMSPANSIEIAVWAAVGGRGTLVGPIAGAFVVNGAKSWLTVSAPEFWLYFLGGLFIAGDAVPARRPGGPGSQNFQKAEVAHDTGPDGGGGATRRGGTGSRGPRQDRIRRARRRIRPPGRRAAKWTSATAASCTWKT